MECLGGLGLCSGPLPRNSCPLSSPSPLPHPHRVGVCPEPPLGLPGAGPAGFLSLHRRHRSPALLVLRESRLSSCLNHPEKPQAASPPASSAQCWRGCRARGQSQGYVGQSEGWPMLLGLPRRPLGPHDHYPTRQGSCPGPCHSPLPSFSRQRLVQPSPRKRERASPKSPSGNPAHPPGL